MQGVGEAQIVCVIVYMFACVLVCMCASIYALHVFICVLPADESLTSLAISRAVLVPPGPP